MLCFCWILAGISIVGILLSFINFCKNKDLYKAEKIVDLLNKIEDDKLGFLLEEKYTNLSLKKETYKEQQNQTNLNNTNIQTNNFEINLNVNK